MSIRSLLAVGLVSVLSVCTASEASAQTGYMRLPQGYRMTPQPPQRYAPQYHAPRYTPRYQPSPWARPRAFNVTTPNGVNVFVNPVNGRGSVNFRGFRIGF
jgi:hypothetical protein